MDQKFGIEVEAFVGEKWIAGGVSCLKKHEGRHTIRSRVVDFLLKELLFSFHGSEDSMIKSDFDRFFAENFEDYSCSEPEKVVEVVSRMVRELFKPFGEVKITRCEAKYFVDKFNS